MIDHTFSQIRNTFIKMSMDANVTPEDLAKKAKVRLLTITRFEDGLCMPTVKTLCKMAQALGMTLNTELKPITPVTDENVVPLPDDMPIGKRFGHWKVIGPAYRDKYKHIHVQCQCDCDTKRYVDAGKLRAGKTESCGCYQPEKRVKNLTPKERPDRDLAKIHFGTLIALDAEPIKDASEHWKWKCYCTACGSEKYYRTTKLVNGAILSCGCQRGRQTKVVNITDRQFGFWKTSNDVRIVEHYMIRCTCLGCETERYIRGTHLMRHETLSCGCAPKLVPGKRIREYEIIGEVKDAPLPSLECLNIATGQKEIKPRADLLKIWLDERERKEK